MRGGDGVIIFLGRDVGNGNDGRWRVVMGCSLEMVLMGGSNGVNNGDGVDGIIIVDSGDGKW